MTLGIRAAIGWGLILLGSMFGVVVVLRLAWVCGAAYMGVLFQRLGLAEPEPEPDDERLLTDAAVYEYKVIVDGAV